MRNVEYTETGQVMELRTKLDLGMRGSVLDFSSLEYVVLLPYILGWMYTCGLDYRRITLLCFGKTFLTFLSLEIYES